MKAIKNVLSTSKKFYDQSASSNDALEAAATARRHQLRELFSKNEFSGVVNWVLNSANNAAADKQVPIIGTVPLTDLALFAFKRCPGTDHDSFSKLNQAIFKLLEVPHIAVLPSLISNAEMPDGKNYLPSFGEVCMSLPLVNHKQMDYGYALDSKDLELVDHSFFTSHLLNLLRTDLPKVGQQMEGNLYLCRTFLQAAKFESLAVKVNNEDFGSLTIKQILQFELEYSSMNMNLAELGNLIKTAYKQDIPLADIMVEGMAPLEDVLRMRENDDLMHSFTFYSQKQIVADVVSSNEDKIDTNFNPNAYFDI